jgi:hypothetical protein
VDDRAVGSAGLTVGMLGSLGPGCGMSGETLDYSLQRLAKSTVTRGEVYVTPLFFMHKLQSEWVSGGRDIHCVHGHFKVSHKQLMKYKWLYCPVPDGLTGARTHSGTPGAARTRGSYRPAPPYMYAYWINTATLRVEKGLDGDYSPDAGSSTEAGESRAPAKQPHTKRQNGQQGSSKKKSPRTTKEERSISNTKPMTSFYGVAQAAGSFPTLRDQGATAEALLAPSQEGFVMHNSVDAGIGTELTPVASPHRTRKNRSSPERPTFAREATSGSPAKKKPRPRRASGAGQPQVATAGTAETKVAEDASPRNEVRAVVAGLERQSAGGPRGPPGGAMFGRDANQDRAEAMVDSLLNSDGAEGENLRGLAASNGARRPP